MAKTKKRKEKNVFKAQMDSLRFQTTWGAEQKLGKVTQEVENRIEEELLLFSNLHLVADLLELNRIIENVKNDLGISNEPAKGLLSCSMVAYCLGIESENPMLAGKTPDLSDLALPMQYAICYDNEVRQDVVNWLKAKGYQMSTYLGQPLIRLTNSRIVIQRVVKPEE
jgi:hypothetical protein